MPLVGLGMPPFWLGIMLLLVFGLHLGRLFPVGGYGNGFFGHLHSMFLPALTVALGISPLLIRSLRASLLQVLESDYVTTARSKGISERRVLTRHALRNAVISTVAVLGVNIGFLIGGTVVIEKVFALPGIGQLMLTSILAARLPDRAGRHARVRHPGRARQPDHRRRVLAPRPAREVRLMGAIAVAEGLTEPLVAEHGRVPPSLVPHARVRRRDPDRRHDRRDGPGRAAPDAATTRPSRT